jgi:hypothetical protein
MTRFCSIFNQLLQLFSRYDFEKMVRETKAERHARGFRSWDQFVAMLFCQLGRAHSLREICGGLASCEGRLAHLGATVPAKSTLAYANRHRPHELFKMMFYQLLERCQSIAPAKKFRFKNKLLSLDATVIRVCVEIFDWAKFQRTKGAIKLHFTLDHDGYLPTIMVMSKGDRSEMAVARRWKFAPATVLVFDKAYNSMDWLWELTQSGVFFVTRLRGAIAHRVIERRKIPQNRGVVSDRLIRFTGQVGRRKYPDPLRVVIVENQQGEQLEFLTNHLDWGASTIAAIYKDRWQIELFFKAIKQNLKIKTFVGTSVNALLIQIWTALIALLILKYLQMKATFGWSLSNLVALLRMNLFVYRDLWSWLNDPFKSPPVPAAPPSGFGVWLIRTATRYQRCRFVIASEY